MPVFDPPMLLAIAAVISSLSNLVWAVRRRTSANMPVLDDRGR
ncbi:MAG TPA: hypothetical protein VF637_14085 [Sphingomicrobium sp.]|jgi:hypothetical protein